MRRRNLILFTIILACHLLFFFYNFKSDQTRPFPKKSITVRTHHIPKPKVKASPIPIKQIPRKKKKKPPIKKEALKTLAKSLEKIEGKKEPPKAEIPLTVPKTIKKLHIDQTPISKEDETSYLGILVQCLQDELQLPEEGNVRLQVTILQSGRVEKVEIVYAESNQNKHYLEQALLSLQLPPFTGELKAKRKHTFTFNFCHAN